MKIHIFFLALFPITIFAQAWEQVADFPGTKRDDGVSFVINGKAFCGSGLDETFTVKRDFYSFDFGTESWSSISPMPMNEERQYATAFVSGSFGYVFGGIDGGGNYLNDLWRYDPAMDNWVEMSNLPAEGRSGSSSYMYDSNMAHVIGGKNLSYNALNDVWSYDIGLDSWNQLMDLPASGIWRGVGFNGNAFAGLGKDSLGTTLSTFYKFNDITSVWSVEPSLNTTARSYVAHSQLGNKVYLFGGVDSLGNYLDLFERIDVTSLTIENLNSFPSTSRKGCMSFANGNDFFITTGVTSIGRLNETWVARGALDIDEAVSAEKLNVYMGSGMLHFELSEGAIQEILMVNHGGEVIVKLNKSDVHSINTTFLAPGAYLYMVNSEKSQYFGQLVIAH